MSAQAMPDLINLRILSNVVYFVGAPTHPTQFPPHASATTPRLSAAADDDGSPRKTRHNRTPRTHRRRHTAAE